MRSTLILAVASALVATSAAEAPKVTGNPAGVTYKAEIPTGNANGVEGSVEITSGKNGDGTDIAYTFSLPKEGGPFSFHIHVNPVDSTGNCTSTGGHLNPYNASDEPCDTDSLEDCEVGDLTGKLGSKLQSGETNGRTADAFTSVVEGTPAFVGNRSIVVHAADKSRLACANFALVKGDGGEGSAGPTGGNGGGSASPTGGAGGGSGTNGTATRPSVTPTATPTGAATMVSGSVLGFLGVLAVGAALL
ncbi:hypothetical protein V490_02732 [Pseudogymnoascus sp. VKM F-3557]|nr:hypothetical protein V490_02732 [Pseudogymnoascus sp. VKM F-3557]